MIPINKYFEIIKKQGATGVLALWLWYTHSEVQELKHRLYDCYGKKVAMEYKKETYFNSCFAIKPKDELNDIA